MTYSRASPKKLHSCNSRTHRQPWTTKPSTEAGPLRCSTGPESAQSGLPAAPDPPARFGLPWGWEVERFPPLCFKALQKHKPRSQLTSYKSKLLTGSDLASPISL